ncbi:MAG: ribbon-helix-helix protein, CopG family [Gemmatimonadales bacterium]
MKTISVAISPDDYQAFQRAAKQQGRPVAQLIREAMAHYRAERLEERTRLSELPVLPGHGPVGELPGRAEIWNEVFERDTE